MKIIFVKTKARNEKTGMPDVGVLTRPVIPEDIKSNEELYKFLNKMDDVTIARGVMGREGEVTISVQEFKQNWRGD